MNAEEIEALETAEWYEGSAKVESCKSCGYSVEGMKPTVSVNGEDFDSILKGFRSLKAENSRLRVEFNDLLDGSDSRPGIIQELKSRIAKGDIDNWGFESLANSLEKRIRAALAPSAPTVEG